MAEPGAAAVGAHAPRRAGTRADVGTAPADLGSAPVPARYGRPVQARATVRGVLALQAAANGVGALIVFAYLRILYPETAPEELELNTAVFGLYLVVALIVALPLNRHFLRAAMGWVRDGREPTAAERWNTLTQPLQQTFSAFLVWIGAAVIFGAMHVTEPEGLRIAIGIALAGLVTCTMLYELLDRRFRPVFALALEDAHLPRWRREILSRLMLAWLLGSAVPLLAVGLAPVTSDPSQIANSGLRLTVLVFAGVLAGGLVMRAAAGAVSRPIEEVTDALARVEDGDLDVHVPVTHIGEIGHLQAGVNDMVAGLRERRRVEELFGRQVGSEVARAALRRDPELGGEVRTVTALFVDIDDFTGFTERHTPAEVVEELNRFFEVVVAVVGREGGWVNKFEGDAALCIFGAPGEQADHAARALRAAAALPAAVAALPGGPTVGIGVATGTVIAGHVGTAERYEYTVIGDAVNVAARLTDAAKIDRGVLATRATLDAAGDEVAASWQAAGVLDVRGRARPVEVCTPAR